MREMLDHIDSYELTEWMAFERAFGPLGTEWRDYALGSIHQQLVMGNGMFGQLNFENNPIEGIPPLDSPPEWCRDKSEDESEDAPPDLSQYE